jgi:hypothetical protein
MPFAEKLAKLAKLSVLDHASSLLVLRREPDSEQEGEQSREF